MTTFIKKKLKDREGNYLVTPSSADIVYCSDGETVATKLRKVENDEFSPTITQMSGMSKVGVGEDIDISDNIQEGYLKSAILKGQTLVNILSTCINKPLTNTTHSDYIQFLKPLESGKEYTIIISLSNAVTTTDAKCLNIRGNKVDGSFVSIYDAVFKITNGIQKVKFTPTDGFVTCLVAIGSNAPEGSSVTMDYFMIIEGDHTNEDIPYFTGMSSVKMPVLTTTGKNLINYKNYNLGVSASQNPQEIIVDEQGLSFNVGDASWKSLWYDLYLEKGENYTLSFNTNLLKCFIFKSKVNTYVSSERVAETPLIDATEENIQKVTTTFVAPSTGFIRMRLTNETKIGNVILENLQIEKNKSATTYEPYKSNILTVNEPVELRGIGDIKDALDLATGEYTQAVYEYTFTGDEVWVIAGGGSGGYSYFNCYANQLPVNFDYGNGVNIPVICDRLPKIDYGDFDNRLKNVGINLTYTVRLNFRDCDSNNGATVEDLKAYLKANPTTIQYPIKKSIKTVDLKPLGTNPTTQPYVWKDGHIQLSSEEGSLLPTLDYSVTTSRGGQILENTKHIAKQDKRIYDLEMLMINSSVEDAYQRLLLQNDVQVMSRMDETHLNPMRYYMLTRLIEEKMYEETDMLNKLDTFFLYGDISSDQYFELMDKIFGMEEIIEEDFTEEK